MTQAAWDRIKNIRIDGTPIREFVATVHGDIIAVDPYDTEKARLSVDAYGSNESNLQEGVIQLLAAVKDIPDIDEIQFENQEETDVGVYFIWPGGWIYRTPTYRRPSSAEKASIAAKTKLTEKGLHEVLREYLPDNTVISASDVVKSAISTRAVARGRLVKGEK